MRKIIGIALLLLFFTGACTHDAVIPETPVIGFASDVNPLIANNCAISGCHDGNSNLFSLNGFDNILSHIKAGNANKSKLYSVISTNGPSVMPPNNPLTDDQVRLVYIWIMQGAKNN